MSNLRSEEVTVLTDYLPGDEFRDGLSFAEFRWKAGKPNDTYTIGLSNFVSLEFDSHKPVRPSSINVYDEGADRAVEALATLVGEELAETLQKTRHAGFSAITFSLSAENRFAIADLQAVSPSTPPALRRLTEAMGREHRAQEAQLVPRTRGAQLGRLSGSRFPHIA